MARFRFIGDDESEPYEYFEDTEDLYDDGKPKTYWFDEYEDFLAVVDLLNELDSQIPKNKTVYRKFDGTTVKWKSGKDFFKVLKDE